MIDFIAVTVDTDKTLSESWDRLATELSRRGAGDSQIDVMRAAFFLGAVHIYARLDKKVTDSDTFFDTMDELMDEISCIRAEDLPVMGHA
jgi:hypothetical protein